MGDIASRNNIRNFNALRLMMKKIAETVKDELSYSKLHNILKSSGVNVSKDSIIDYIRAAKDSLEVAARLVEGRGDLKQKTIPTFCIIASSVNF